MRKRGMEANAKVWCLSMNEFIILENKLMYATTLMDFKLTLAKAHINLKLQIFNEFLRFLMSVIIWNTFYEASIHRICVYNSL